MNFNLSEQMPEMYFITDLDIGTSRESVSHLLMFCDKTLSVWNGILRWLGWQCVPHKHVHSSD